jgi:hypothetical protein
MILLDKQKRKLMHRVCALCCGRTFIEGKVPSKYTNNSTGSGLLPKAFPNLRVIVGRVVASGCSLTN